MQDKNAKLKTRLTLLSCIFWGLGGYTLAKVAPDSTFMIFGCFLVAHFTDLYIQKIRLEEKK